MIYIEYMNKRNWHKVIEAKFDKESHVWFRQRIQTPETGACNYTGDGKFHRISMSTWNSIKEDYIWYHIHDVTKSGEAFKPLTPSPRYYQKGDTHEA